MKQILQTFYACFIITCLAFTQQAYGQSVFINEIHYDNAGSDVNEAIEIAGPAGTDLTGWNLVLYNGSNSAPYDTRTLSGVIPNQGGSYGFVVVNYPANGIQNGSPDGVALVNAAGAVVQFLSYEGSFTAVGGAADGLTSTDIGVAEASSSSVGYSLQLTGTGAAYEDFTWSGPSLSSFNAINTRQSFGGGTTNPDPEPQAVTIAQARNLPIGTEVIVNGTLTVAAELGGPAFIQDETGGIALFDAQVHGAGLFMIGDSIKVIASIGSFNGQVQLVEVTDVQNLGPATHSVAPKRVTIADLNALEGQLVIIPNASFTDTRGLLFPESNYNITDGTGTTQIRIEGPVTSLVGRVKPQSPVNITGVVGSFNGNLQILPRFIADLPGTTELAASGSNIAITKTLDVMTWNMEFFGSTLNGFGPNNNELQLQNAKKLIDTIHADIIAVQEISDENLLQQLVDMLPGNYQRVCSERYSYSFEGPDPTFPAQKLCFIYNADVISLVKDRVVFEELYDAARSGVSTPLDSYPGGGPSSFWSSGRLPYMITVNATVEGVTQKVQLINIHAKSGSANEDLLRRAFDIQALKDTLNQYYPNANLIILGDYNDDVDESISGGPSPYQTLTEAENFRVVTASLSEAGLRSFITQDNVIDHITISDDLFDNYLAGSETLILPFSFIVDYANTTSDHLPVLTRFELARTYYKDVDGDGYGRNNDTKISAMPVPGYVLVGGDCVDWIATIYPGAPELANGMDDNCNGQIDEGLTMYTYYKDVDGDGFGRNNDTKMSAVPVPGYVLLGGDCVDWVASIYPGAPELANGRDDNCNGQIDEATAIAIAKTTNKTPVQNQEAYLEFNVTVYPVPSAYEFNVQLNGSDTKQKVSLRIFDDVGRLMEVRNNLTIGQTLTLGDKYAKGFYIIEATQGSRRKTVKVMKL